MEKIKIHLNGKEQEINSDSTVEQIIQKLELKNSMFVAELNMNIVQKNDYLTTILKAGDKLEVVTFFGGG